jgi:hypothetical protein
MTSSTESSSLDGQYQGELFAAAAIVVAAVAAVVLSLYALRKRRGQVGHGGLVTGQDNRRSTGRVIAVGWTMVVAWMVVCLALIAAANHTTLTELLKQASYLYFVFLGGPWAAAAFALLSTQSKIAQGTLTKIPADAPSFTDVVSDDNGNADTFDFQYTLFNLLAMAIVVFGFVAHPGHGLPDVPQFLAVLTGGSALTYTVNKALATSGPQITSVQPSPARVGDTIAITGIQLVPTQAASPLPAVSVGGIPATPVAVGDTNTLTAVVPAAPANTMPLIGAVDVVVTPSQATPIVLRGGLNVGADQPRIISVAQVRSTLTVTGKFMLAPGVAAGSLLATAPTVAGLNASLQTTAGTVFPVQFTGAYSNDLVTLVVGAKPAGVTASSGDSVHLTLTLTRGTVSTGGFALDYKVP